MTNYGEAPSGNDGAKFWLAAALGFAGALLAGTVFARFGYDQEAFDYTALAMLRGGRFYVDYSTHNAPGVTLIHMAVRALLGWDVVWFRLVDVALQLVNVALLFRLARRAARPSVAFAAAVAYALFYFSLGYWNTGQRDGFVATGLLLMLTLAVERPDDWRALIASALIGWFCTLIRPTYGVLLIAPAAGGWLAGGSLRRRLARVAAVAATFLAATGAFAAYLRRAGSLEYLNLYVFDYGVNCYLVHDALSLFVPAKRLLQLANTHLVGLGCLALIVLRPRDLWRRPALRLAAIAAPFVIAQFLIMRRGFGYQTIPVMATLLPLAAGGWEAMLAAFAARRRVGAGLTAVLLAGVFANGFGDLRRAAVDYRNVIREEREPSPLVDYIRRQTGPDDYILEIETNEDECFAVGFSVYARAQRLSSSPIAAEHLFGTDRRCVEFRRKFMDIYWRGVDRRPPKLVFAKAPIPAALLALHHLPPDAVGVPIGDWWVYVREGAPYFGGANG